MKDYELAQKVADNLLNGKLAGYELYFNNSYVTHHQDWVEACTIAYDTATYYADRMYWKLQLDVLAKLKEHAK